MYQPHSSSQTEVKEWVHSDDGSLMFSNVVNPNELANSRELYIFNAATL